jgi:predicted aspartyl protease
MEENPHTPSEAAPVASRASGSVISTFRFPMTVSGPYGAYTVDAVVDPDATFSAVPEPALVEMGIEPVRVVQLRDERGSRRFYRLGRALVTVAGVEDLAPVLFVEAGEPTVIGATTLALLLLEPDEANETLVQIAGREPSVVDEAVG